MDEPSRNESNTIILRIKFKSPSLEEFTQRYGSDVSPGGIFIKTKQPLDVGTSLQFEFSLADGSPLLFGYGTVAWIRENDPMRSNNSPGMGLRFDKLNPDSYQNHQKILAGKTKTPLRSAPSAAGNRPATTAAPSAKPAEPAPLPASPHLDSPVVDLNKLLEDPSGSGNDGFSEGAKTEITDRSFTESILAAELAKRKTVTDVPKPEVSKAEEPPAQSASAEVPKVAEPTAVPLVAAPFDDSKPVSSPVSLAPPEPDAVVAVDVGTGSMEIPLGTSLPESVVTSAPVEERPLATEHSAPIEELQELSAPLPLEDVPEEVAPERTIENPANGSLSPKEEPRMQGFSMLPTPVPATSSTTAPPATSATATKSATASGKWLWAAAVAAAVIAFVLVYLLKTKPWEAAAPTTSVATVTNPQNPLAVATPKVEMPAEKIEKAADPSQAAVPEKAAEPSSAAEPAKAIEPAKTDESTKGVESAKVDEPAKVDESNKPEVVALKREKGAETANADDKQKTTSKPEESSASAKPETYRWAIRSVPANAEVLIDGEYFCRTPCDRRVLDPSKPAVIVLRKVGFEPFERSLGPSETWVKKGKDNFLTITGKLTKVKATPTATSAPSASPTPSEPKTGLTPPPLAPKPEGSTPSPEGAVKSDSTTKSKAKPAPDF